MRKEGTITVLKYLQEKRRVSCTEDLQINYINTSLQRGEHNSPLIKCYSSQRVEPGMEKE